MTRKHYPMADDFSTDMKSTMTMPRLLLLLGEVLLFAILAVMASSDFGLADGLKITAAYLVAYLVPRAVLTHARGTSTASRVVLLLLTLALIYVNYRRLMVWVFFDDFSLEMPNLNGDGRGFYKWALNKYDGRVEPSGMVYPGFPLMMLALWKLFGVSVVWPQAMNLMFVLTSVVLTGMTTRRLLSHRVKASPAALLTGGMILCCLLMYYFVMGTAILKEASIMLAVSLAGFVLAAMEADDVERHRPRRDFVLFIVACALMGFVRTTYLYFVLMGLIVLTLSHPSRDWRMSLAMLGVIVAALLGGSALASYSFDRHAEIAGGGWNMQRFYVIGESQQFYHDLLNYYFLRPFWYKALMLPLTISVQFIIPFPWAYYETPSFLHILGRMTYGWYFIGGISLFYFCFVSWRREGNMGWWPWWAALAYTAIAYIMAGAVARYVVPVQPLFIPVAMYVLCRMREGHWRKPFLWWSVVFVVLLTVTLLFCLEIQQATFSKMLGTRSLLHYLQGIPY